jgi:DNA recombination protein RmuC
MFAVQWTPEIIAICAASVFVSALLGYCIAALRHGRQISRLSTQLEQAGQLHTDATAAQQELQTQLKTAEARRQQLQVIEGKLQATLQATTDNSARLLADLQGRLEQAEMSLMQQRKTAEQKQDGLHEQLKSLESQHTRLMTQQKEREASHAREVDNFEQQKAALSEQFKLLSSEILEAKAKSLQESSKLTLSAVISPFQQSIDTFKKEVQDIHHRETTQQGELRKELEQLKELNQRITLEAHELSTALRGQKKLQGNWGELVLENVLDRSGLQADKDYKREVSITGEDGRQRPDVIVYLPQDKHLIIDSKVSLNAYVRFVNSADEVERAAALKEHVHAVGSRIRELADREYFKLPGINSPEMVFMFVPIESAFVEALKADEQLFQNAIENNVLVATPTTLLTSLNIVRQLWRFEDQNKHTAALASKAEAVFNKLNTFLASFEKIKKGLEAAAEAYTKAEGQLVSGKGNLVKQVGDFKKLAPAIKAELPAYFLEKAVLEIDFVAPEQITTDQDGADDIFSDDLLDAASE